MGVSQMNLDGMQDFPVGSDAWWHSHLPYRIRHHRIDSKTTVLYGRVAVSGKRMPGGRIYTKDMLSMALSRYDRDFIQPRSAVTRLQGLVSGFEPVRSLNNYPLFAEPFLLSPPVWEPDLQVYSFYAYFHPVSNYLEVLKAVSAGYKFCTLRTCPIWLASVKQGQVDPESFSLDRVDIEVVQQGGCAVCGYGWPNKAFYHHEICPCCGTQFGYDDAIKSHAELRKLWVRRGIHWWGEPTERPEGWDPEQQMRLAGLSHVE